MVEEHCFGFVSVHHALLFALNAALDPRVESLRVDGDAVYVTAHVDTLLDARAAKAEVAALTEPVVCRMLDRCETLIVQRSR